jgi:DNA-binding transcriptional ArsR family regulator
MASHKPGRQSVWVKDGNRTPLAHKLVLLVNAGLEADGEAMTGAILKLQEKHPEFKEWPVENLRRRFYETERLPPPELTQEESRWVSLLLQWGKETKRHPALISAEQAREIVYQLIAFAPQRRRADLDQLFGHPSIHLSGRNKIKWLRLVIARLKRNPNYWPIPISRYGRPDVTAGKILSYVTNAPGQEAYKCDIIAGLDLLPTTGQTTLSSMTNAGWLVRKASGKYGLPREGVSNYVPGDQAVLNALAAGAHTFDELVTATGLPEGAVTAAIHRLKERKVVILKDRGKNATYALAGTASPHVYTREAVIDALRSGKRMTVSELVPHTGKGRGEIYAALHRLEDEGLVKRFESPGQPLAFAAVFPIDNAPISAQKKAEQLQ